MSGDDRAAPGAGSSVDDGRSQQRWSLHRLMKALFDLTPWGLRRRIDWQAESLAALQTRVEARIDHNEQRLDAVEESLRTVVGELEELRVKRVAVAETRLDGAEQSLEGVIGETARLRDEVVPAVVGRADVLLERLAAEIDELGSLVERMLRGEPLPVSGSPVIDEKRLASALAEVQPVLLEAFRGTEAEIQHRLDRYLEPLRAEPPVLDIGCGRGELLLLLREAGVEATGIEGDPAVARAARRRGLDVIEGDVLATLRDLPDASRGAVTAIHFLEHLEADALLAVLAEIRRVLRPGGVFIAESPNPHSLRVGAALYWVDPTHRRPLLPETLELYLTTSGFNVDRRELLHPFPAEQLFAEHGDGELSAGHPELAALDARIEAMARRLDELVNGPRDFVVWATKPDQTPA